MNLKVILGFAVVCFEEGGLEWQAWDWSDVSVVQTQETSSPWQGAKLRPHQRGGSVPVT